MRAHVSALLVCGVGLLIGAAAAEAQERERRPRFGPPEPEVVSPEVGEDRTITFRLLAPGAESVRLASSDLPDAGRGVELQAAEDGVWQAQIGPVEPGAYRYTFQVDGMSLIDPRNTATSESNGNLWSLAYVPGSELSDLKDVPHGALAEVRYYSKSLERFRRMHVYTPPGYEAGEERYPVLYLLHGAMDSDDSWSTVGRAGFILDHLIASGKARPMVVVMPMGHTRPFRFGPPGENSFQRQMEEFITDFEQGVRPLAEQRYRLVNDRSHRAVAGLSMGGAQTLDLAARNLRDFGYVGVFSSGVFGIAGGPFQPQGPTWEERHLQALDNAELKSGLKLVWFATGEDDFLLETTRGTVRMLKQHGFEVTSKETAGGHTWTNWRNYLGEFAPLLFREE